MNEQNFSDALLQAQTRPGIRRPAVLDCALLILLALLVLLPGFSRLPVTDRDEARFVQATKQMVESGDFIDIRFQEAPRYKKPAMIYWLQGAAVALVGQGADTPLWIYRLPSLLGAILSILLTYAIGRRFGGANAGLIAGIALATTVLLGIEARLAKTDAALLATVLMAQWVLADLFMEERPRPRFGRNALFWTALGLGILIKGPVILVVSLSTLFLLAIKQRSFALVRALTPLYGGLYLLLLIAPWLIAIGIMSEGQFFVDSIGNDLLAKVASGQESHGAPFGTHALAALFTFWPLSAFLPWAFCAAFARQDEALRTPFFFLVAWIVPGWLLFEAVPTKLPNYVLPFLPALAVFFGVLLARTEICTKKWWVRLGFFFIPFGAFALVVGLHGLFLFSEGTILPWGALQGMLALVIAWISWRLLFAQRLITGWIGSITAAALAITLGLGVIMPDAKRLWLSDQIAHAVSSLEPCESPKIIAVGYREPSLVFRLGTELRFLDLPTGAAEFSQSPCVIAIVPAADSARFVRVSGAGLPAATVEGRNLNGMRLKAFNVHAKNEDAQ